MSKSQRLFKFRLLLTLSLAYGCSPSLSSPQVKPSAPSTLPAPSSTPSSSDMPSPQPESSLSPEPLPSESQTAPTAVPEAEGQIKLLSATEIETVRNSGLVEANNAFGWQLFERIYAEAPAQNHFISPISATLALQMQLQGAKGETLTQMQKALHLENHSQAQWLEAVPLLVRKLQRPAEDIQLEVANSLWANQSYRFAPEFVTTLQQVFNADALNENFSNPALPKKINAWTAEKTHDKISEILDPATPLTPDIVSFLINAIYFKGNWSYQFEKAETQNKPFYREDGTQKEVPMMRQFGGYQYLTPSQDFPHQGVILPYGKEHKIAMYLFLPTTGKTLKDLQQDLNTIGFEKIRRNFYRENGSLQMPRFKFEQGVDLIPALKELGMPHAFIPYVANFKGMSPTNGMYISDAQQFTYVDVNEEGTEAAAVTVIGSSGTSSEPLRSMDMRVDHPFLFLIRDQDTGQILFMGTVTDPSPGS